MLKIYEAKLGRTAVRKRSTITLEDFNWIEAVDRNSVRI